MKKVFIDGSAGTTGLRIHDRLSARGDLELLTLPEELRKEPGARLEAMQQADVVFLCLPDAAAIEAEALIDRTDAVILDTSTAHRTAAAWCYGFPELSEARKSAIRQANASPFPGVMPAASSPWSSRCWRQGFSGRMRCSPAIP